MDLDLVPFVVPFSFTLLFGPLWTMLASRPDFAHLDMHSGGQGWPLAATGGLSLRVAGMSAG